MQLVKRDLSLVGPDLVHGHLKLKSQSLSTLLTRQLLNCVERGLTQPTVGVRTCFSILAGGDRDAL